MYHLCEKSIDTHNEECYITDSRINEIFGEKITMVNVNKLRGKIVEKGMNVVELAHKIGMDKATFYRRLNEKGETFSIREVNAIVRELALNRDEAMDIFFDHKVS